MFMGGKSQGDDAWLDSDHRYHHAFKVAGGDEKRMNRLQSYDTNDSEHEEPHEASYCNPDFLIIQLSSCTSSMCVTG